MWDVWAPGAFPWVGSLNITIPCIANECLCPVRGVVPRFRNRDENQRGQAPSSQQGGSYHDDWKTAVAY